jgi:hypothetical protein
LLEKIRVFKIDYFVLTLVLAPNLRSMAQIFSHFGSKINEFERKKSEIRGKISKT